MTAVYSRGYESLFGGFVEGDGVVMELFELLERPGWHALAACRGSDPDLFFPARGEPLKAAKSICGSCPVRAECAETGLANREKFGIWGGLSERERRRVRRDRNRSAA